MNSIASKSILAALLIGMAGFSQATTTITFSPLTSYFDGTAGDGTTYMEGGLTFTSQGGQLRNMGFGSPQNADIGGAVIYDNYYRPITISKSAGGTFDLASFDLISHEAQPSPQSGCRNDPQLPRMPEQAPFLGLGGSEMGNLAAPAELRD